MKTLTATNGMVISEEAALQWAALDGVEFRRAVGHLSRKGYGAVELRRRVSAYSELRRQLRTATAPAKPVAQTTAATPKGSMGDRIHARHVAKGLPASPGTKRDGTPKAHCFGCFVNQRGS